jgi:hypothetical protein
VNERLLRTRCTYDKIEMPPSYTSLPKRQPHRCAKRGVFLASPAFFTFRSSPAMVPSGNRSATASLDGSNIGPGQTSTPCSRMKDSGSSGRGPTPHRGPIGWSGTPCQLRATVGGLCRASERTDLGTDGRVAMPLEKTFWAERFGMVVDRFGIPLINCEGSDTLPEG